MTSFGAVLKQITKNKFQTTTKLILLMFLADIALSIFMIFTNGVQNSWSTVFFRCTIGIVIVIEFLVVGYLCKLTIDETINNKFRLIPISDTGLYLSSIISNVISFIYVNIINIILLYVSAIIAYSSDKDFRKSLHGFPKNMVNTEDIMSLIWIMALFLLLIIAFILLINASNLLTNITINMLPVGKQKFVRIIINLIILFLILKLMSMIDVSDIINTMNLSDNQISIMSIIAILLEIILFSVININLLRFVETNK